MFNIYYIKSEIRGKEKHFLIHIRYKVKIMTDLRIIKYCSNKQGIKPLISFA